MTPESVESLMVDLEEGDPFDFSRLSIADVDARKLMASHFCELDHQLDSQGLSADQRLEVMAAIAAHAMVENFMLQLARLRSEADRLEFKDWLRRYGIG